MKRAMAILIASVLSLSLTAAAIGAPKPNIEDPQDDANGINDQGTGDGSFGDVGPAPVSSVGNLLKVTLTNDKKNVYAHVQTLVMPPATQGTGYRVRVNPDGPGGSYCLYFESFHPGATNDLTEFEGHLRDLCTGETIPAVVEVSMIGGMAIVVPRSAHEAFGKGKKLTAPQAASFVYSGSSWPAGVMGPFLDTTKPGTDYAIKK